MNIIIALFILTLTSPSWAKETNLDHCAAMYSSSNNPSVRAAGVFVEESASDCDYDSMAPFVSYTRKALQLPAWTNSGLEDPLYCIIHSVVNENLATYCKAPLTLEHVKAQIIAVDLPNFMKSNPSQAARVPHPNAW